MLYSDFHCHPKEDVCKNEMSIPSPAPLGGEACPHFAPFLGTF